MGGLPKQATRMTLPEAGNPDSVKLGSGIWGSAEQLCLSQSGRLSQGVVPTQGSCLCRLKDYAGTGRINRGD
ncbi:hypothetical protein ASPTUDRAFT_45269 [Aspergillus tubingensis CBS 134.48]|uniref:Uncharacterized protein n=1 Tax=Aspergillus tubingensis (strain CBS 134.48) TaxID=767770 RepID=A0A1L9MY32_ASPTC|nr:hypothetical protein ASPTUDRAFT_45269 [Aspergillus tubingensis CBS 134.48]